MMTDVKCAAALRTWDDAIEMLERFEKNGSRFNYDEFARRRALFTAVLLQVTTNRVFGMVNSIVPKIRYNPEFNELTFYLILKFDAGTLIACGHDKFNYRMHHMKSVEDIECMYTQTALLDDILRSFFK